MSFVWGKSVLLNALLYREKSLCSLYSLWIDVYFYALCMYFWCSKNELVLAFVLVWVFELFCVFVFVFIEFKTVKIIAFFTICFTLILVQKMYYVHVLQKLQSPSENCKAKLRGLVVNCEWFLLRLILSWTQQHKQRIRHRRLKVIIDYRVCDMHYNVCMSQDTHLQSV